MKRGCKEKKRHDPFFDIKYAIGKKTRDMVLDAVGRLPLNERIALLAYVEGGLCVSEIAQTMNVPVFIASMYLKSAQEFVMKELKETDADTQFSETDEVVVTPVLKVVFDCYKEDTITDEQVQRVLEPVLKMIRERRFEAPEDRQFIRF